jgi:hypothetical protein
MPSATSITCAATTTHRYFLPDGVPVPVLDRNSARLSQQTFVQVAQLEVDVSPQASTHLLPGVSELRRIVSPSGSAKQAFLTTPIKVDPEPASRRKMDIAAIATAIGVKSCSTMAARRVVLRRSMPSVNGH